MKKLLTEGSAEASKVVVVLAAVMLVIAGMKLAADFIVPILLAFFIATISFPITNWLREHKWPRSLAVLVTVLVDFAFLTGVVLLGIVLVSELQSKWSTKYYQLTTERIEQFTTFVTDSASELGIDLGGDDSTPKIKIPQRLDLIEVTPLPALVLESDTPVPTGELMLAPLSSATGTGLELFKDQMLQWLSAENLLDWGKSIFQKVLSFIGTAFVVMLLTIFMLSEARMFARRFNAICDARGPNLQRMLSATHDIQKYLGIKTLISMATGLLAGVLCWAVGLEFPLLWGILAFALNFIPAVGSVIAGIPPILLSLLTTGEVSDAVIIGGGYLLINGILGNFLEPTLLGRRFGISTVVVIFSVIFWGWLWGPIGMLLAVPLTMLLKVALDNSSDFRWMAVAISKGSKVYQEEEIIKEGLSVTLGEESKSEPDVWTPKQGPGS